MKRLQQAYQAHTKMLHPFHEIFIQILYEFVYFLRFICIETFKYFETILVLGAK